MIRRASLISVLLLAAPALAEDVPLPRERPTPPAAAESEDGPAAETEEATEADAPAAEAEPDRIYQTQCPMVVRGLVEATLLAPIEDEACREQTPWEVTAVKVGGRMVPLSAPATLSCEMAGNLPAWAETMDGYLKSTEDTELAGIVVGTSYLCRDVNGGEGRLSEHGLANALDVVGFELADGRTVAVEDSWSPAGAAEGRFLRFSHASACSIFSTTLGPEANADHHDHFHIDMGCHGGSCTARLCD